MKVELNLYLFCYGNPRDRMRAAGPHIANFRLIANYSISSFSVPKQQLIIFRFSPCLHMSLISRQLFFFLNCIIYTLKNSNHTHRANLYSDCLSLSRSLSLSLSLLCPVILLMVLWRPTSSSLTPVSLSAFSVSWKTIPALWLNFIPSWPGLFCEGAINLSTNTTFVY